VNVFAVRVTITNRVLDSERDVRCLIGVTTTPRFFVFCARGGHFSARKVRSLITGRKNVSSRGIYCLYVFLIRCLDGFLTREEKRPDMSTCVWTWAIVLAI